MKNKILYKKSQRGYVIPLVAGLVIAASYMSPGPSDTSKIILMSVLLMVSIMFYKLTIVIDEEKIYAYFGYNLFTRKMYFRDMNFNDIKTENIRWYTGIGIRFTDKGWLYNVNFGKAIRITSHSGQVFYISTNEPEAIKAELTKIKS
jgi:hypothetical protein